MQEPVTKTIQPSAAISMLHTGAYSEIGAVHHQLREWARLKGVKVTGPGMTIFHSPPSEFDSESAVFEVCLPVEQAPAGEGKIKVKELPGGTVASVTVTGPYHQIPAHYTEMLAWLSAQSMEPIGPPREVYVKRPDAHGQGDPETFVTEIQFPVEPQGG